MCYIILILYLLYWSFYCNVTGTIFGMANTLSSFGGWLSTFMVGELTKETVSLTFITKKPILTTYIFAKTNNISMNISLRNVTENRYSCHCKKLQSCGLTGSLKMTGLSHTIGPQSQITARSGGRSLPCSGALRADIIIINRWLTSPIFPFTEHPRTMEDCLLHPRRNIHHWRPLFRHLRLRGASVVEQWQAYHWGPEATWGTTSQWGEGVRTWRTRSDMLVRWFCWDRLMGACYSLCERKGPMQD